jgi:dTDP-4-dehydrorhamnose 3,5-epimerase-like enzyme
MAQLINLESFHDNRGSLTVIEKNVPFTIKRVFYIYNVDDSTRGKHRHKITKQAAICLAGQCTVYCDNGHKKNDFILDSPEKMLILEPEDWHYMYNFSANSILLVLASEEYNSQDYIYDGYS